MPKRLIDFDALWTSKRLEKCAVRNRGLYLWIYGLADAGGSFESTNLRAIWAKVAVIRPDITQPALEKALKDFETHGLLYSWTERGNKYSHFVGSQKPGRLPPSSTRGRYYLVHPQPPTESLAAYDARYRSSGESRVESKAKSRANSKQGLGLGLGVGLGLGLGRGRGTRRAKRAGAEDGLSHFLRIKIPEPKTETKYPCPDCGSEFNETEFIKHGCQIERSTHDRSRQLYSLYTKSKPGGNTK
jgi:hypothetical protein